VSMVAGVISAEHFRIEVPPPGSGSFIVFAGRRKRVTRGANADESLAGDEMIAYRVQLLLRQPAPADAHEQKIGVAQGFDQTGEPVLVLVALLNDRDTKAAPHQFRLRKLRQGFPGFIFVFPDQEHNVEALVFAEAERLAADERHAGDARTP